MTIDIVIPCYGPDALMSVEKILLAPKPGIRYIVPWQKHENKDVPVSLCRPDVVIIRNDKAGLSHNRNLGIVHSTADIIMFADDDVTLLPDVFDKVERAFTLRPETEVATFKTVTESAQYYPEEITALGCRLPKNYFVKSVDIAIAKSVAGLLRFDERFGLNGSRYGSGEDELFHLKARRMGLKCVYFPYVTLSHPHPSTGTKTVNDNRVLKGMGVVIQKSYPWSWPLRIPLKAYRLWRKRQSTLGRALVHLYAGAFEGLTLKL